MCYPIIVVRTSIFRHLFNVLEGTFPNVSGFLFFCSIYYVMTGKMNNFVLGAVNMLLFAYFKVKLLNATKKHIKAIWKTSRYALMVSLPVSSEIRSRPDLVSA